MPSRIAARTAQLAFLCILATSLAAEAQVPETEEQKTVYALGRAVARNLKLFALSPDEVKLLIAGLSSGLADEKSDVDPDAYKDKINELMRSRSAARAAGEREASTRFLAEAASQKGAQKTASGLVYQETKAGAGAAPTKQDDVVVHYTGKRRDGSVFDSSVERGEPADFPLARMIPCWTEGLQLMKPGGKAVITCPADLAYGDTGLPPGSGEMIAPGAALRFEVELISVEKGGAAKSPGSAP
ncbi:MAG: FKBP-type peptidyl-prolyl cis-trans isomerase [Deltaproteobacteria bacterium]|nr:FKBP-type peptidyl-prolyl cis-trans isomerase [Deltaproteobacteria bacterium]